ncbi:MAG: DUF5716 family protein [Schaedlerella sp.]|nr:DUF5716 family protein [Schaedlerella sp.]
MSLISRIPREFYKLFGSKYVEYYMMFLVSIYEETLNSYSVLGMTEDECRLIMNEKMTSAALFWDEVGENEEGEFLTRSNMAAISLKNFVDWGWLKRDFDETLNSYVVSFPDYSQAYVELFQKLYDDEESPERESVLTIYSHLYTYSSDVEQNNDILKSALQTSKRLVQLLVNMQESMRGYFDELSVQREFRGIQEVLIREINNSDSKKYAILTTTDSFYRYKEAVKELIDQNLGNPQINDEAVEILCRIQREFDAIERRYNKLIEQKTLFASRAAARIRYIMQEGAVEEEQTAALVNLLNKSKRKEEILTELGEKMQITSQYRVITERSMYQRRSREREVFSPQAVEHTEVPTGEVDTFVLKPLYTQNELRKFRKRNETEGKFHVTKDTVQTMEDLEKLFFIWQKATEVAQSEMDITVGQEFENEQGFRFSELTIKEK